MAGELPESQLRKFSVVASGQALTDVADLCCDEMEVVEEPFGRWGDEFASMDRFRERPVGVSQDLCVVFEAGEEISGPSSGVRVDGEPGSECPGAFVETLDAEQLVPQRAP